METPMTIRIAIIGAGIMGADHARIIAADMPGATLQVVCDASEVRARAVADETGAANVLSDPLAVIGRPDVDAVLIASPDDTHADLAIAAIRAGKPVLCEKPLAPNSADCLRVIDAEIASGRHLIQVGFMRRFDPSYTEMKAALTAGRIGPALMFHCFHRNVSAPSNFTGQMAISNSAPHEFDVARFVLDTDYASISVFRPRMVDPAKTGAPVFMVLETNGGQLVNVEINNNAAYGYDVRGELVGESGSVFLRGPVHSEIHTGLTRQESYPADWRPRFAEAYRLQNRAWLRSIQTGIPSPIAADAWDGYCATLVAEAGVASLTAGQRIAIKPTSRPEFYARFQS
jgi:myo-inositol 2-dehydrogenase / D-chiro-inositol 1-dehydrogenase